jgi:MoaA/NifB/PqqE/SkfB family radical SAM enzyme
MDYNMHQNRMEDRMKIIEGHIEAIEENAQYINNEIVNNSETLKVLRDNADELIEDVESLIMLSYKKFSEPSYHPRRYYNYMIEKRNIDWNDWEDKFKEWEEKNAKRN